ncbi:hypothetical protein H0H87_002834 [Tephrocybe sp. NHM501043]|nr:hypothetical protein H0H87_002834 [Tephrocybe sp. NHM501043]
MIPAARAASERLKAAFRDEKHMHAKVENTQDDEQAKGMVCKFCQKNVSLPCWVSLISIEDSQKEFFVCDDCDRLHHSLPFPEKMVKIEAPMVHAMLHVKDDKHVEIQDDDQLVRVEKRLSGVKSNVEERMNNLEQHLSTRTIALESIITGQVQEKIQEHFIAADARSQVVQHRLEALEGRFDSLERLLQELLNRTNST